MANPGYRGYAKGLVHQQQVRGQAWSLRTLADAAYVLPKRAPLEAYFDRVIANNIRWYNNEFTDNSDAHPLRILDGWHAIIYSDRTAMSSWQQSFFMWALGSMAEKGFDGAERLRDWFAPFQIKLMTDSEFCWELASAYRLKVRDTPESPLYEDLGAIYWHSFPKLRDVSCDSEALNAALKRIKKGFDFPPKTMVGYPYSPTGFPANFQIGLAASVVSGLPGAKRAWQTFAHRSTQPDYAAAPQFAVIPEIRDR